MIDYKYKHVFTVIGLLALVYVVTVVTLNVVVIRGKLQDTFAVVDCPSGFQPHAALFAKPNATSYGCWKPYDSAAGCTSGYTQDANERQPSKKCLDAGTPGTAVVAASSVSGAGEEDDGLNEDSPGGLDGDDDLN